MAFYRTVMYKLMGFIDRKLEQWARRKYKTLYDINREVRIGAVK